MLPRHVYLWPRRLWRMDLCGRTAGQGRVGPLRMRIVPSKSAVKVDIRNDRQCVRRTNTTTAPRILRLRCLALKHAVVEGWRLTAEP